MRRQDTLARAVTQYNADTTKHGRKASMNVGHIVLVRQSRVDKLSTAFNDRPLTVADMRGSMITTSRPDGATITGNQSLLQ